MPTPDDFPAKLVITMTASVGTETELAHYQAVASRLSSLSGFAIETAVVQLERPESAVSPELPTLLRNMIDLTDSQGRRRRESQALARAGIMDVRDVLAIGREAITHIENLAEKSLVQIDSILAEAGLPGELKDRPELADLFRWYQDAEAVPILCSPSRYRRVGELLNPLQTQVLGLPDRKAREQAAWVRAQFAERDYWQRSDAASAR